MGEAELSLSGLVGKRIDGPEDFKGRVVEFLLEPDLSYVRYIAVAHGQGEVVDAQLVPSAAIAAFPDGSVRLRVTLKEEEIGRLPSLSAGPSLDRAAEAALHDAIHWKPYWDPGEVTSKSDLISWERLRQAKCVFQDGRECGFDDLIVDADTWHIAVAVLRTGEAPLSSHQGLLPTSMINKYCRKNGELRLFASHPTSNSTRSGIH